MTPSNLDRVRSRFGQVAEHYAVCKVQSGDYTLARMLDLVRPQPDWVVADVACGAGHTAALFAPHVAQVIALDATEAMLAQSLALASARGLGNVTAVQADAQHLPLADASADLVTCRLAVHHFEDPAAFLAEAWRVLRPGGVLAIVDSHLPDDESLDEINAIQRLHDPSHMACLTRAAFETALAAAGFHLRALEEGKVRLGFATWTGRVGLDAATCAEIRARMTDRASAATGRVLDLQPDPAEEFFFHFQRITLIGQKA